MPQSNGHKWWIATMPHRAFLPYLPDRVLYLRGQLELGAGGFLHWQFVFRLGSTSRLPQVKAIFGTDGYYEPTRSDAAIAYVWKEDTYVHGTRFELGTRPSRRNEKTDWDAILLAARTGDFESIPANVLVPHYRNLRNIRADYMQPISCIRTINVFWGRTGTGKSRRAWDEAGFQAYPKDPLTKFWDGYQGEKHVVIDEFRGIVSIGHVLRWFDRYPVRVEIKGSATVLVADTIWITSNLDPRQWYPDLDAETLAAFLRRLQITHFDRL
uniref:Replication associated protein n=1 Tax=Antarctic circular DNA molecule TaxID=2664238 RepID=A0A5Q2F5Y8_9ZZZZ|nr:replication associated protein [Antarctic circular DNA molecule]